MVDGYGGVGNGTSRNGASRLVRPRLLAHEHWHQASAPIRAPPPYPPGVYPPSPPWPIRAPSPPCSDEGGGRVWIAAVAVGGVLLISTIIFLVMKAKGRRRVKEGAEPRAERVHEMRAC